MPISEKTAIALEINEAVSRVVEGINPLKLVLFGSMASGENKPESDVDLCVISEKVASQSEEAVRVRKIMGKILFPVDILVFSRENFDKRKDIWGTIQYEVDKKGKILYER